MGPLVHIVILNWNSRHHTLACLASLDRLRYAPYRVIVVDNGSTDDSPAALERLGDQIVLLKNAVNRGFSGGCNDGIAWAMREGAAYVWLLNGDALTDPETLAHLVAVAEADPRTGLVSPLLRGTAEPGPPSMFCGRFDPAVLSYDYTSTIETGRTWQETAPSELVLMGTALLVRRRLIETIGGLDEGLFAYWEDADYSIRSIRAGFRNVIDFDVSVYHPDKQVDGRSEPAAPHHYYYMARNEILLLRKYGRGMQAMKALSWALRHQLGLLRHLGRNTDAGRALLAGVWHGWLGRTGMFNDAVRMPALLGSAISAIARA